VQARVNFCLGCFGRLGCSHSNGNLRARTTSTDAHACIHARMHMCHWQNYTHTHTHMPCKMPCTRTHKFKHHLCFHEQACTHAHIHTHTHVQPCTLSRHANCMHITLKSTPAHAAELKHLQAYHHTHTITHTYMSLCSRTHSAHCTMQALARTHVPCSRPHADNGGHHPQFHAQAC
jgi:hypothetical protein